MTDKDILISDLNDISEILNNNGYGGWCETIRKVIALLKEQQQQIWELQDQVEYLTDKLKEQEAVEPIPPTDESDLWRCGNCNNQLFRCTHQRYCEMCGRELKWE